MQRVRSILLIDSEASRLRFARDYLDSLGYEALAASDPVEGLALFAERRPEAVVCEHNPPATDGMALCRRFLETRPGAIAQLLSDDPTPEMVDEACAAGAFDLLRKPLDPLRVHLNLRRAVEEARLRAEKRRLKKLLERRNYLEDIMGGSPPMRSLYELIDEVAAGDIPALVLGGKGTEMVKAARTIHKRSPRASSSLVEVRADRSDARKIRQQFGLEGSGPDSQAPPVDAADGGTLLIAEVGRLDLECQGELLDILEERRAAPPGGPRRPLAFRLVSTSSEDLFQMAEEGRFRRDLYYRVNVAQIMMPSLRERLEDIPLLAHWFLRKANKKLGTRVEDFSLEALLTLVNYRWPGNVDELERVVFQACRAGGGGVITHQHLPIELYQAAAELSENNSLAGISFKQAKSRFEIRYFTDLLRKTNGNMTQAADQSKVGRPYLYKKLQEHNLKPGNFRAGSSPRERATSAELRFLKEFSTSDGSWGDPSEVDTDPGENMREDDD